MGNTQSSQCNMGTFGTGVGVPITYDGQQMNLGGSSICQTDLRECISECKALGCDNGSQGIDCCKLCEGACCNENLPSYNANSPVCKQMAYNAKVRLPDDYCTNLDSRNTYDNQCPTGCLASSDTVSSSLPVKKKIFHNIADKIISNAVILLLIFLIFILFLQL